MTHIDDLIAEHGSRQSLWHYLFYYEDGLLFWKNPRAARTKVGDTVGCFNARYWSCSVCSKRVYLHKIIYEMHNGDVFSEVDHIDRDTSNNRIENLRAASRLLNVINTGIRKDNKSGYKGVSYNKANKCFLAQVNVNGRRTVIGKFDNAEDAAIAYADWYEMTYPDLLYVKVNNAN